MRLAYSESVGLFRFRQTQRRPRVSAALQMHRNFKPLPLAQGYGRRRRRGSAHTPLPHNIVIVCTAEPIGPIGRQARVIPATVQRGIDLITWRRPAWWARHGAFLALPACVLVLVANHPARTRCLPGPGVLNWEFHSHSHSGHEQGLVDLHHTPALGRLAACGGARWSSFTPLFCT